MRRQGSSSSSDAGHRGGSVSVTLCLRLKSLFLAVLSVHVRTACSFRGCGSPVLAGRPDRSRGFCGPSETIPGCTQPLKPEDCPKMESPTKRAFKLKGALSSGSCVLLVYSLTCTSVISRLYMLGSSPEQAHALVPDYLGPVGP